MNFYNLYMLNSGWTPYSNIDIAQESEENSNGKNIRRYTA